MYKEQCYSLTHKYSHCMIYVVSLVADLQSLDYAIFACSQSLTAENVPLIYWRIPTDIACYVAIRIFPTRKHLLACYRLSTD